MDNSVCIVTPAENFQRDLLHMDITCLLFQKKGWDRDTSERIIINK